jgi:hypothetical protein
MILEFSRPPDPTLRRNRQEFVYRQNKSAQSHGPIVLMARAVDAYCAQDFRLPFWEVEPMYSSNGWLMKRVTKGRSAPLAARA